MARPRDIPGLDGRMSFREVARVAVAVRAAEVFEHADGVLDTDDIERVHDMRVATRRLRAILEVFEAAFERGAHRDVLKEVKRLADALGARRDPDVQLARLAELARALPEEDRPGIDVFAQRLRVQQAQANQALAAALEAMDAHDLHGRLQALVAAPPAPSHNAERETAA
jgi:CHAD domain-containing protein